MKINRYLQTAFLAVVGLALATTSGLAQLQTNVLIEPSGTDTGGSGTGNQLAVTFGSSVWQNWFVNNPGITNYSLTFDTNNPPPTGDILGSVLQEQDWDGVNGGTLSTFACVDNNFWGGATVDMTKFTSLDFDFKYDTNSTIQPTNRAQFNVMVDNSRVSSVGVSLTNLANAGVTASNFDGAWHHLSIGIPSTIAGVTASKGPGFELFNPAGTAGGFRYWVANLTLIGRNTPPPPPTVATTPIIPGLWQFADQTPNYNRQDIETVPDNSQFNLDWVGRPKPVTYSWTIGAFPKTGGFDADMTITPDPASSINYADPDWSATNAIWLNIQANGDGTITAGIAWKTNSPAANGQFFAQPGQMIPGNVENTGFTVPSAVGTWSLTFTSDTAFTLTAPNGAHTNAALPADIASAYTNVSFNLNSTMNQNANAGQYCVYTALNITGVQTPVHETFQGGLNTPFLQLVSQGYGTANLNPPNQIFATTDDAFWFNWTLPDAGYSPVSRPRIGTGSWNDLGLTNILLNGGSRWILVPKANLPSPSQGYFALVKRVFTKLQVLFPGETAAPGTPTGKTGTPDPYSIATNSLATFTVNAVDSNWFPITTVNDTIMITSSDNSASLPPNLPLINGTGQYSLQFGTAGTWTVTATDVTTNATAGVSSPIVVGP